MTMKHRKTLSFIFSFLIIVNMLCLGASAANVIPITLPGGAIYTGDLAFTNVPHGTGIVKWEDGSTYEGEFSNGMLHGNGVFRYPNGEIYEGDFEYGFRSGKGKISFTNSDTYSGGWLFDMMHGKGKYTHYSPDPSRPTKNDVYNGEWRFNMMHGKGVYILAKGKTIEGYWVKNEYRGSKLTKELKSEIGEFK